MAGEASTARPALGRFVEGLRASLAGDVDEQADVVTGVEERVRAALTDDGFILDCLEAALVVPPADARADPS